MTRDVQLHLTGGDLIDARRVAMIALIEAAARFAPGSDLSVREVCDHLGEIGGFSELLSWLGGDPSWPVDETHGAMTKPQIATLAAAARTTEEWAAGRAEDPAGMKNPDSYDTACWAVCQSDLETAEHVLALAEGAMEEER